MSVHVNDLGDAFLYAQPLLDGQPLTHCVELDEFEGWADVHDQPCRIINGDEIAKVRLHGDVQLRIVDPRS